MAALTRPTLEQLDREDPLAAFRDEFVLPEDTIYLDGNSLGAMPKAAAVRARSLVEREWAHGLIRSWNDAGWYELPRRLGGKLAGLIGAAQNEVVVTDSTSVDLYKVLSAALDMRPDRRVIVMEGSNFPTDNYIAQGLVRQRGSDYSIRFAEADALTAAIDDDVAVVCLTEVHYKTGRILDMAALTAHSHAHDALAVWDVCHSAGAMNVDLAGCNADFAVGCTYKYLNGGPGSPGFIFAAQRHHGQCPQPLTGWWGHADPFAFERDYRPAADIRQMQTSTQPVLSMAVCEPGIDIARRASIERVRQKSQRQTSLFIELLEQECAEFGLELASPRNEEERGSQVSLRHADGYAIMQALIHRGVVGDYREPGNLRFGFAPLYLRYSDIWDAVATLRSVMKSAAWREPMFSKRIEVT